MIDFAGMMAHERRKRQQEREKEKAMKDVPIATKLNSPEIVQLSSGPSSVWYCDTFLTDSEAATLEQAIRSQHRPAEWIPLAKRRLLNLGGVPHPDGMLGEELPAWMQPVLQRLEVVNAFPDGPPNQCLLNEYDIGQGIDPHSDGPLFEPRAAVLSLCTPALLQFLEPPTDQEALDIKAGQKRSWDQPVVASVVLRPGSLVVFADEAYCRLLHGVADGSEEVIREHTINRDLVGAQPGDVVHRGNRLSLTLRRVKNVAVQAGEFMQPAQQAEIRRRRAWWARSISEKVAEPVPAKENSN
mmetsp:Transcript_129797/g.323483  ORF Transcript_129797/g.323483 Transcript_129797/m.323483 type:complete len:299 (+) Transcript_129797:3-899(+)